MMSLDISRLRQADQDLSTKRAGKTRGSVLRFFLRDPKETGTGSKIGSVVCTEISGAAPPCSAPPELKSGRMNAHFQTLLTAPLSRDGSPRRPNIAGRGMGFYVPSDLPAMREYSLQSTVRAVSSRFAARFVTCTFVIHEAL